MRSRPRSQFAEPPLFLRLALAGLPILAARATYRAAQEFRLLVHLLEAVAAPRLGNRLCHRIGGALGRLRPPLSLAIPVGEALALPAIVTRPVLVAPERTLLPFLPLRPPLGARMLSAARLRPGLLLVHGRLRNERLREAVLGPQVAILTEFVEAFAHLAEAACARATATVGATLARLVELLAVGHDDA